MSGLTRRAFLSATAALAGSFALPVDLLGPVLAAPTTGSKALNTLRQTIKQNNKAVSREYRLLTAAGGEPYIARTDILGKQPAAARVTSRRSLLYFGHVSDIHIVDAQSPARLEPMMAVSSAFAGAWRPQDTLTVNVLSAMVGSIADNRYSPVTGAPLGIVINTGDSADSLNSLELQWYIDVMDGVPVTPNSGQPGVYEGVQVWDDATYCWHPANPADDLYGAYGYPTIPGLLDAVVSQTVHSPGLPVPWLATYGNHDVLFIGTIAPQPALDARAIGSAKSATWPSSATNMAGWWASKPSVFQRLANEVVATTGLQPGVHSVTADPARKLFDQVGFMQAHLDSPAIPGPPGHGFSQNNINTGQTWWSHDLGHIMFFGLDTCNQVTGADGAVPADQFDWLGAQLAKCQSENKLAIIASHHNSYTLDNVAESALGASQPLIHAEQFIDMLLRYPNMIAWINGHTHINTITAHRNKTGTGGFWEITTASCVDYPQQQQLVEVLDNADGTLSIFTTTLDHASPAEWTDGDFSQTGLASLSRQLAANSWIYTPLVRTGSELDRNTELLLPAPFDLSTITASQLELANNTAKARLLAYDQTLAYGQTRGLPPTTNGGQQ